MSSPFSVSYGQNAEDVVLRRALRDVDKGFYVEVGANDPTEMSVSRAFYDAGWRGVAVEPVAELAERYRRERPRDQVVHAAVTDEDVEEVTLHLIEGTGLSSLDGGVAGRHQREGYVPEPVRVPARTLDRVLAEADVPRDVHFMVVDTEGTEARVLRSIDLGRWRPWVLVIEATEPLTTTPSHEAWEPDVLAAGYQFRLFDGVSRFYVAEEHAEQIGDRLSYPANVLDDFIPLHWHRREQDFRELDARYRETLDELVRWRGSVLERWAEAAAGGTGGGAPGHEVVRLREELAATHSTVSWRVTAPLRRIQERRLRGVR